MNIPQPYPRYRHYKGAEYYKIAEALHTETEEIMVVYLSIETNGLFVRPKKMFEEMVTVDKKTMPRFTKMPYSTEK